MGIFDKLKGTASSVKRQADKALDQHGDKLVAGVDKAGGAVNKATKGKYADKVDKGVGLAKKPLSKDTAAEPTGPVVDVAPVDPADPTSTTGTVGSDDPADGSSRPGSPSGL